MRASREQGDHGTENTSSCNGPNGEGAEARSETAAEYRPESNIGAPPATKTRLGAGGDVARQLAELDSEMREHFILFTLDVRHQIIERRTIAIGCLTGVEVHPREVFKPAILDSAAAIIIAHNHPSGDPSPSREDVQMTTRLREVGKIHGIEILDHVIVAKGGLFSSLAERGWV